MFFTDMVESKELDFFETANLLECDKNEKKQSINNDGFYELLQKNKDIFNYEIDVEKKEEQTSQK